MSFKRFEGSDLREPKITLNRGYLEFSKAALEKHFGNIRYVSLWYDKDTGRIGIKPEDMKHPFTYSLFAYLPFAIVNIKNFCEYHGIDISVEKEYPVVWDDERGLCVLEVE
jgi:hypothetical protein